MVKNLLLINIAVFILQSFGFDDFLTHYFGLRSYFSQDFIPYQFVTYIFLHGGFMHLLSNMFGLIVFGPLLEQFWGAKRFLFFFFFTGIGAGLLHWGIDLYEISKLQEAAMNFMQNPTPNALFSYIHNTYLYQSNLEFLDAFREAPTSSFYIEQSKQLVSSYYNTRANGVVVGASGAIFGILMAFGLLFPNTELFLLLFPFPIKAKYFVALYGLYEVYSGFQRAPGDSVAHFAHIGGMLFAYILIRYWGSQRNKFY